MKNFRLHTYLLLVFGFVFTSHLQAHFIWVAKSTDSGKVQVFFGEGLYPDRAEFLGGLKGMKVWAVDAAGKFKPLAMEMKTEDEDGWYEASSESKSIDLDCEYGVFSRGDKSMLLHYCAKYVGTEVKKQPALSGNLKLDVQFKSDGSDTVFQVLHQSKPAVGCELQITDHADETHEFTTNDQGEVKFDGLPQGQWKIRAKLVEDVVGKKDGQDYDEKRTYCVLVLGDQSEGKPAAEMDSKSDVKQSVLKLSKPFPAIPVGITSFGGAVAGDYLYLYGGHCGDAHDYYQSGQNAKLHRLNLKSPEKWELVSESVGMQGLAMIQHDGNLYRVGGFIARNKQGEDQDLHSSTEFAMFDFDASQWVQKKPLPIARSSTDAVVVGDTMYVAGGWTMRGGAEDKQWCEQMVSLDLSDPKADWQVLEVPFKRRALSIGHQDNKLYVVGGMKQEGGPTRDVMVYNLKTKSWSEGPALPGKKGMDGFGTSCFNIGGRLVASTYAGSLLRLSESGDAWEKIFALETGRFFHRLLPLGDDKFMLVGGANMSIGKLQEIEVYSFQK